MPTPTTAVRQLDRLLARVGGLPALGEAFVFFAAYLLLGLASYRLTFSPEVGIAGSWPPSGLALGVLVRSQRRRWPLLAGAIVAAILITLGSRGLSPGLVAARSVADVVEPLVGALLIQRALPTPGLSLLRVREVYLLVVCGGIAGPAVGTLVAVGGALAAGMTIEGTWWSFALSWWLSAFLGTVVVGPLVLTWAAPFRAPDTRRLLEAALLAVVILGLTALGFAAEQRFVQFIALALAAYPLLVWSAIRFGPAGAAWGAACTSLIAIVLTVRGAGPFVGDAALPAHDQVVLVQGFFALAVIAALVVAALAAELRRSFHGQQVLADAGAVLVAMDPIETRLARVLDLAVTLGDLAIFRQGDEQALVARRRGSGVPPATIAVLAEERAFETAQRCDGERCWTLVPLQVDPGRSKGTLAVRATRRRRYFDTAEVRVVENLAHGMALAVERERLMRESDRLYREAEDAVLVRDEFLSIASHELKTPLTPLSVHLELLKRRARAGLATDVTAIEKAQASLGRLAWLINDLLDVSRIQAGNLQLQQRPTSLTEVVEAAIASTRPNDMERIVFVRPPADLLVNGDPRRLEQVASNLIDNALKYSPAGSTVGIELRPQAGEAILSVEDRGIGIPEEQRRHLFDRFFRARNVSATRYGGLGLGLYIVRDIVERHGGRVWAESEVGEGSIVRVALPLLGTEPWPAEAPPSDAAALH